MSEGPFGQQTGLRRINPGDTVRINKPTGSYGLVTQLRGRRAYVTYHYGLDVHGEQVTANGAVMCEELVHVTREEFDQVANGRAFSKTTIVDGDRPTPPRLAEHEALEVAVPVPLLPAPDPARGGLPDRGETARSQPTKRLAPPGRNLPTEGWSVLQAWVFRVPPRGQGTLLTGIRGCDLAPKNPCTTQEPNGCSSGESTPERHLVAFLRWCVLNPADPREVDVPGGWFQSRPPGTWKPSQLGHYPLHWYGHLMHCFEVVGFWHPKDEVALVAQDIYVRLAKNLHLEPENSAACFARLTEDRLAAGTVVS